MLVNRLRLLNYGGLRQVRGTSAKLEARASLHTEYPSVRQIGRIVSGDALRGFAMFWIIGGDGTMVSLDQILRNQNPVLRAISPFLGLQFTHNEWEGVRFYDVIFPLFILVTGISVVLSLPSLVEREGKTRAHIRVFR